MYAYVIYFSGTHILKHTARTRRCTTFIRISGINLNLKLPFFFSLFDVTVYLYYYP